MSDENTSGGGIIPEKYRNKDYKGAQDWMTEFLDENCTVSKQKERIIKGKDGEADKTIKSTKKTVDVDALFQLCESNNLNVEKYRAQMDNHGFVGRFRMTTSNMLRAAAKKRHGLYNVKGSRWVDAPEEWLSAKGAPDTPTHDRKGELIVKKKETADA